MNTTFDFKFPGLQTQVISIIMMFVLLSFILSTIFIARNQICLSMCGCQQNIKT